ncbi:myosin-10-like [Liolophura sinensis]|uniref:myosin-10-like n=1 Tax=Liolophura sinensis TaxID=3198878 RepID=UPI0031594144
MSELIVLIGIYDLFSRKSFHAKMASLLGTKKKGKKSKVIEPVSKDVKLIKRGFSDDEHSGSQVSVREALQENTADNIKNEAQPVVNDEPKLKPAPQKGQNKSKGASQTQQKGDNPGLAKPAWRGQSVESVAKSPGTASTPARSRNAVKPLESESNSFIASSASLPSAASLKEAWSDDSGSLTSKSSKKGKKDGSVISLSKADKNERNCQDGDTISTLSDQSVVKRSSGEAEQHAYVPYVYARNCVARITNDMTNMKANHVKIVREIETNYHLIEDETQSQFNTFILLLRTEYTGKVNTFRQVIEAHRLELQQKEDYWNQTLKSLSDRNRELLSDKKALLIKNKLEVEKLEKEKESTIQALSLKLEQAQNATTTLEKEKSEQLEKSRLEQDNEHLAVIKRLEEEKLILTEQLESEKSEIKALQQQLSERGTEAKTDGYTTGTHVIPTHTSTTREGTLAVVPVSDAEKGQVSEERQKMAHERKKMEEERAKMAAERDSFLSKQEQFGGDLEAMQAELTDTKKECAELRAKYNIVSGQAKDVDRLTAAYKLLEEQYSVLASVTTAAALSSGDAQKQTKENIKKTESEVAMMKEARSSTDKDIEKWEKEFEKANGRSPTVADRNDSVKEMYTSREEVNTMLDSLERKKETLQSLQSGEVPTVKPVPQASLATAEPVITTVEVMVPDPKTVQVLEECRALVAELRAEIAELNSENTALQGETTDLRDELDEARQEMDSLRDSGVSGDTEALDEEILRLKLEMSSLENKLVQETSGHDQTREELDSLTAQLSAMRQEEAARHLNLTAALETAKSTAQAELKAKDEVLQSQRERLDHLEKERLSKLPPDTAKEIKNLQAKVAILEKEKLDSGSTAASVSAKLKEAKTQLEAATSSLESSRAASRDLEGKLKKLNAEKDKSVRELTNQLEKKDQQRIIAEKNLAALQTKMKSMDSRENKEKTSVNTKVGGGAAAGAADSNTKRENVELKRRIKELEAELKRAGKAVAGGGGAGGDTAAVDRQTLKKQEKILKELEKKLDMEMRKREKHEQNVKIKEEELATLQKECDTNKRELTSARAELSALGVSAQQGMEAAAKVKTLETEVKRLTEENKTLTENFNSERVLRKKYYNMVEDMKGKIRVYCRSRPLSKTERDSGNYEVVKSPDEYSIHVESSRGLKEFQFDQIFMPDSSQEKVFEDTNNLIQSAVDGYNVCIFAYGQTGSGKTFTMIGDREQSFPGIAPRAFSRIFDIVEENKSKYDFTVTTYMLELYNDHLIDLYGKTDEDKLDIKKDKQGMVFVQGAAVKRASNSKELYALFEEGSKNRHVASTKMNAESSRSHLILAIVIESTNKVTGQVTKGKLSLVDLAGSERVGKTGASAEQLKEAMSINKSLSALGDVISALSSEQAFIPYRNNKLTMLMQDSLGGNAKTLMFVNISPANYNCDESIISLTYASRVKLITNSAQKNADNKEIARLKDIINKLKQGENVDEDI